MGRGQELLDAAREGHSRTVEKLLAQINKRSGPFTSLRRGAGPNVQDDNGYTPLHHACLNGHRDIIHSLLEMGASPCTVDKKGATPLHLAAFKGDAEAVAMLLDHHSPPVNVDQLTHDGDSALLIAAQFGFVNVVSQLVAKGADVTVKNINGDSALDLAAHYGKLSVVRHLLHVRPQLVDQYMHRAECFTTTPLHRASMNGRKDVVKALIEAGMDPNVKTANGTPLHEAARYGKASVVRVLLKEGADLRAMDSRKKTVYDLLAEYPEEALRKVRKVIREYNTNAATYDSENEDLPPFPVPEYSPTPPLKTSDTQKNTNTYDSFLSPSPSSSSLNKHHPQSFVKKFASKYLGLKAKFSSAPNISNSAAAEVDVKSKQSDHKHSTNTLLIGNSKFFKMLSKKEESGEIICNDEFDTISLDRLGSLNRDSVVNRSNRSCPGFKTSLPNISENNELSDSQESVPESVVITELDYGKISTDTNINEAVNHSKHFNIFEPRETSDSQSVISRASTESRQLVNECYESYEVSKSQTESLITIPTPVPPPRPTAIGGKNINDGTIYENIVIEAKIIPKPAARIHIPVKSVEESQRQTLYENITVLQETKQPEPHKRTLVPQKSNETTSSIDSRSSTMSSDSMFDETNLEDILLSEKSKSFRHRNATTRSNTKSQMSRTQSLASDTSDVTEASALENVDCSGDTDENSMYLAMTGTLPNKKSDGFAKKKVLFRHKTFTNIEVDRNSVKVKDLPEWNNEFLKETLAHYHIRGTGHCVYKAPTVEEFIYIFNRDTLYSDTPPFTKVPNTRRDSEFETAICFCRPRPPKFHSSAEDLLDKTNQSEEEKVIIDFQAIKDKREMLSSSFKCYCVSSSCTLHSTKRDSPTNLVVKFSAIKRSISTPDITLNLTPYSTALKTSLPKNKSVPSNLEEPYAVISVEDIIARNAKQCENTKTPESPVYTLMSQTSTVSSTTSAGPYSIKDIAEVISLSDHSTSIASTVSRASGVHLPIRKSSSSEYSGHWSLHSCNSNVTIQSEASFKSCLEESSDDSDGTLHSDAESSDAESSDAETVKSDVSTAKRPWVHSDSFRFGSNPKPAIDVILEESQSSPDDKSESSKYESGICLEGSVSSLSECEDDSGIPRSDVNVTLDCASLERVSGMVGGVRSGSGRRRWDEAEGTSEGDALSVSSATSSCAPLHLAHHHPYSKVSPTPPKKPPRRNLSVSPTHGNSPSSGYSYELRPHARSQDDLDDIQGAKHYLKHGRSVDQYVDGKLSYSEYEENHNSPRVAPVPNPRPSLKQRSQPVAITAMYENVVIKEQNPRRKLRRNNFVPTHDNYEQKMADGRVRKYSHQEKSSLESLLDDQSMNSPSDCERYYEGPRADIPMSPTHYEQPPTPDHPPPSARQAENCIHERIRPLSQLIMEVVEEIRIRKMSQNEINS